MGHGRVGPWLGVEAVEDKKYTQLQAIEGAGVGNFAKSPGFSGP